MTSMHQILYLVIVCLLIPKVFPQEIPEFTEEYIDEELPESKVDTETAPGDKLNNKTDELSNKKTQHFTDDRFTKLFQPRRRPPHSPLMPKYTFKAKPTLPSFIKNTQPLVKVQPTTPTPQQQQRFNQRTAPSTQRTTTTRTPSRIGNNAVNRRNQISNNRLSTQAPVSTSTADSSRRRFGGTNRRFNTNSTIPATSRPKRN